MWCPESQSARYRVILALLEGEDGSDDHRCRVYNPSQSKENHYRLAALPRWPFKTPPIYR